MSIEGDVYKRQANEIEKETLRDEIKRCVQQKKNMMFYHDIQGKNALNFIWMVNDGTICLIGYVPTEAIQQEGRTVNYNIFIVVMVMPVSYTHL